MSISRFDARLFIALMALLFWLPLPLGSNRMWSVMVFLIGITVIALAWLAGWRKGWVTAGDAATAARPVLWLSGVWLGYLGFSLVPLPQVVGAIFSPASVAHYRAAGITDWSPLSVYPWASSLYWLKSCGLITLFVLVLLMVNSKRRLVLFAYVLVASGLVQAFYGSMMTLSGLEYGFFEKKYAYIGFATGTFINRNHLAGYLEMTLAIGIGLLLATWSSGVAIRNWKQRVKSWAGLLLGPKLVLRVMLAIMVIALVLTRSRMGNTAFFSSMLIAGAVSLLMFRMQAGSVRDMFEKRATRSTVILLSSLLIIDLAIVGTWFGVEKVIARIEQSSVAHDADRVAVSLSTVKLWQDYLLVGSGGGSFHAVFPGYRQSSIGAFYDHTHQDYLEFGSETGVLGIGLLALIVLTSLRAALLAMRRRRDPLLRGMAFASVMGITALLIHSTVDFNLQIPANAATFMCILALGWIALAQDNRDGKNHGAENHAS